MLLPDYTTLAGLCHTNKHMYMHQNIQLSDPVFSF